jgi:hypothetical protein
MFDYYLPYTVQSKGITFCCMQVKFLFGTTTSHTQDFKSVVNTVTVAAVIQY